MSYSFRSTRKAPAPMQRADASIFSVEIDPNTGMVFIAIPEWDRFKLKTDHTNGLIQNILNTVKQNLTHLPINQTTLPEITSQLHRLVEYNRGVPEFDAFLRVNGY